MFGRESLLLLLAYFFLDLLTEFGGTYYILSGC